jgi:hypothetical protein
MNRKGIAWPALIWLIIGVLFLIVIIFVIMLGSGKLSSLTDAFKSMLRFGG